MQTIESEIVNWRCGGLVLAVALCVALAGCKAPRAVREQDPEVKIPWMKRVAREKNAEAAQQLVGELEDEDAAVRLYAITALKDLTGQTLEYRYYEPAEQRAAAVERWKQWVAQQKQ